MNKKRVNGEKINTIIKKKGKPRKPGINATTITT